ncbi:hypothetical protein B9T33_06855 [Acinetobacter sp. ANC 5054]|uniref:hypothetical protein n=1 Tax=Acinetobacter sp. ANC 5054 TaxID=1977877 RepID=UPI000A340B34|nr:hypothetical protein [Acinetobacter sp. ANC 5054]OTG81378.1 hypothetical protein B9T33_06855 [Acinetobacter sp. ANC 5054]
MQKLLIAAALFALMLWIWSEYFRAIPNLQQTGVLKNFQVTPSTAFSGQYLVLDKRYYSASGRTLHPASPTVVGGFQDLAYVSNIDLLLSSGSADIQSLEDQLDWSQQNRCFSVKEKKVPSTQFEQLKAELQNVSVIAQSEAVANRIRRLKSGDRVEIQGEWVDVHSIKTGKSYNTFNVLNKKPCHILKINSITRIK